MRDGIQSPQNAKPREKVNPARIMVLGFLLIISLGTLLLSLPVSSCDEIPVPFLNAFFTSVSATCVTGLVVVDTALTWSLFGRIVILFLIQIGGLGFMSVASVFFFLLNKKINLSQRLLIMQSLNLQDLRGVVRLIRHVIIGTFIFEGIGAVILWTQFIPQYGLWSGLGMGIFHSISAFCNAGFDLMGNGGAFSGLTAYSGDAIVMITVMSLVVIGGLGFFVWEDIWRNRQFKYLHLHSKMVLVITLILVLSGWIFFYIAERENPATIGSMPIPDKILASLFQSIMPRSGGLNVVDQTSLTGASRKVLMLLMLIGGSAGSAAGGVKNVTVGIIFLSVLSMLKGKSSVSVFRRSIHQTQVISAFSILVLALSTCFIGTIFISLIQPELPLDDVAFEMVSAVATCGLSSEITHRLSEASMIIVMLSMFLGRIGIMTVGMAAFFKRGCKERTKYPDTWVMM